MSRSEVSLAAFVLAFGIAACSTASQSSTPSQFVVSESCPAVGTPKVEEAYDGSAAEIPSTLVPDSVKRVATDEPPQSRRAYGSVMDNVDYPDEAIDRGEEGVVHVAFVVDTEGIPRNLTIGQEVDRRLEREARDAVREMRFTPGTAEGRAICVPMSLPISFRLQPGP